MSEEPPEASPSAGWREVSEAMDVPQPAMDDRCPSCGAPIRLEGGCATCVACDWSRCDNGRAGR